MISDYFLTSLALEAKLFPQAAWTSYFSPQKSESLEVSGLAGTEGYCNIIVFATASLDHMHFKLGIRENGEKGGLTEQ